MLYILRHAEPAPGDFVNRERPLSAHGQRQAQALVPLLRTLRCAAVYTSPFARAVDTIRPYAIADGRPIVEVLLLAESGADESLPQVRDRMVRVVSSLADSHPDQAVLVCTHGGNMWGLLAAVDISFGYEQYRKLGTPDMRLLRWQGTRGMLDEQFRLPGLPGLQGHGPHAG